MGPIDGARVGYIDGECILNPTQEQIKEGGLDLVAAGTYDAVLMVESEAKELSEDVMLGAVMFAHKEGRKVIEAIIKLAEQAAKEPWELAEATDTSAVTQQLSELNGNKKIGRASCREKVCTYEKISVVTVTLKT